ncbi:MAG: hypothetical protein HY011_35575 [Acidobacteria bacterium]|nr:hypothetical protein [Acidobacteriota bacterium]
MAKFCVVFYLLPPACLRFFEGMRFAFEAALRDAFTGTSKIAMPAAESGGSTHALTAADPVANTPRVLNAKMAAQTERKLCDCGFISRSSFLNTAIVTMREAQSPQQVI